MSNPKTTSHEREQAVHAITERNRLTKMIAATHEDLEAVQERLGAAIRRSDEQEVKRLCRTRREHENALPRMRLAATQYDDQIKSIKAQMRGEEEVVRRRAEEAIWRHAEWKRDQQFRALPGFRRRVESPPVLGFVGATVLLLAATAGLLFCLR